MTILKLLLHWNVPFPTSVKDNMLDASSVSGKVKFKKNMIQVLFWLQFMEILIPESCLTAICHPIKRLRNCRDLFFY